MTAPLIFLDTETCGLGRLDPIWEIGLIRREPDGMETEHHFFVEHDVEAAKALPESFQADHAARYDADEAKSNDWLRPVLEHLFRKGSDGARPHVVGAVPNFDTERIEAQIGHFGWHYHLIDVENLAVGWMAGRHMALPTLPWDSDAISARIGVSTSGLVRHTALDDARWAKAIYDRLTASQVRRADR